eukprot:695860-Hanusia_phi.AAC.1
MLSSTSIPAKMDAALGRVAELKPEEAIESKTIFDGFVGKGERRQKKCLVCCSDSRIVEPGALVKRWGKSFLFDCGLGLGHRFCCTSNLI